MDAEILDTAALFRERVIFPAPELPQSVQLPGYNKSAILRTLWNGGYLSH